MPVEGKDIPFRYIRECLLSWRRTSLPARVLRVIFRYAMGRKKQQALYRRMDQIEGTWSSRKEITMDTMQNLKNTWSKAYPSRLSKNELTMSAKVLLKVVVPAVLLVAVLLAAQVMASQPEPALNTLGPLTEARLAGSDWVERHPTVVRPANYYAGSDWVERHPAPARPAYYYELVRQQRAANAAASEASAGKEGSDEAPDAPTSPPRGPVH